MPAVERAERSRDELAVTMSGLYPSLVEWAQRVGEGRVSVVRSILAAERSVRKVNGVIVFDAGTRIRWDGTRGPARPDLWQVQPGPAAPACPGAAEWTGGMSGSVFISDQVLLDVSFEAARRRLRRLTAGGLLRGACEYAYATGITGLAQQAGPAAAPGRLAGVLPADLIDTGGCARLPLRWQATGPGGALFPALDANLTLSPAGQATTVLELAGVYRLPPPVAARLGPAAMPCLAGLTIRSLIARLACALAHPAGTALPAGRTRPKNATASLLNARGAEAASYRRALFTVPAGPPRAAITPLSIRPLNCTGTGRPPQCLPVWNGHPEVPISNKRMPWRVMRLCVWCDAPPSGRGVGVALFRSCRCLVMWSAGPPPRWRPRWRRGRSRRARRSASGRRGRCGRRRR